MHLRLILWDMQRSMLFYVRIPEAICSVYIVTEPTESVNTKGLLKPVT